MSTIVKEPKGFKQVESVNENGDKVISFEPINESIVPKNWEDFCDKVKTEDDWYIGPYSGIGRMHNSTARRGRISDRNLLSTEQRAKAMLAFIQLIRVRDYVNGDWEVDWGNNECKYYITTYCEGVTGDDCWRWGRSLCFKTPEIRDQFLTNFRGLIEEAKEFI